MPGRWTQYDEDEYRLPEGMRRTGYDSDTGQYTFQDTSGSAWEGPEYGTMYRVQSNPVQSNPVTARAARHYSTLDRTRGRAAAQATERPGTASSAPSLRSTSKDDRRIPKGARRISYDPVTHVSTFRNVDGSTWQAADIGGVTRALPRTSAKTGRNESPPERGRSTTRTDQSFKPPSVMPGASKLRRSWSRTRSAIRRLSESLTRSGKPKPQAVHPTRSRPNSQQVFPTGPSPSYLDRAGSLKIVSANGSVVAPHVDHALRHTDASKSRHHKKSASFGDTPPRRSLETVEPREPARAVRHVHHPASPILVHPVPVSVAVPVPGSSNVGRATSLRVPEAPPQAQEAPVRRVTTVRTNRAVPLEVARDRFMAPPDPSLAILQVNEASRRAAKLRHARARLEREPVSVPPPVYPMYAAAVDRTAPPAPDAYGRTRSAEEGWQEPVSAHGLRRSKKPGSVKRTDPSRPSHADSSEYEHGHGHAKEASHASTASASARSRKHTSLH